MHRPTSGEIPSHAQLARIFTCEGRGGTRSDLVVETTGFLQVLKEGHVRVTAPKIEIADLKIGPEVAVADT